MNMFYRKQKENETAMMINAWTGTRRGKWSTLQVSYTPTIPMMVAEINLTLIPSRPEINQAGKYGSGVNRYALPQNWDG